MNMKKAFFPFIVATIFFLSGTTSFSRTAILYEKDSLKYSTSQQAIQWVDSVKEVRQSTYWVNVSPGIFMENLRGFALHPLKFYEGRSNNFCAYLALTTVTLSQDPLGFCQFMFQLYTDGTATFHGVKFSPEKAVRTEAGLLKYKGTLDLNEAAQMWFLSLADRFKGYLNFFNRHFDKGDENTLWASTNYAKFNRMIRRVCDLKVHARGSDLIRPFIKHPDIYIEEKLKQGSVFLYLNNRLLYKKKHKSSRFSIPTHYIMVMGIQRLDNNTMNLIYWDYGLKSIQQISPKLLKKIVFGITEAHIPVE